MNPQVIIELVNGAVAIKTNITEKLLLIGLMEAAKFTIIQQPPEDKPGILLAQARLPSMNGGK